MKNPLFLKVISVSDSEILATMPDQIILDQLTGELIPVEPNVQVTLKKNITIEEGEVYATDTLVKSSRGWYVAGNQVFKVADSSGLTMDVVDKITNPDHQLAIDLYTDYTNGVDISPKSTSTDNGKRALKKVSFMSSLRMDENLAPPTIEDDGWWVDTELWYHLIRSYAKRKNTLLIGDSGAGKTELVRLLMRKIGKPLNIFDMAISNPNKALCGNLRAEGGKTYYQYARFAKKIQQEGAVLLDEISRANPTANNILLPVLDGRRTLYIEDAINDSEIEVNEKCTIFATANIGTKFIGTNALDHALLNRFSQVGVEYPPKEAESLLLQKVWGLPKRTADEVVGVADIIRKHPDLSKDISTRQLMEIAELISDGYTKVKAFEWSILHQFEADKGDGGERQEVRSIIGSF